MDVSMVYVFLDEHYSVQFGLNAYQLKNGECPRCGHQSSDLRLYCKSENELQELADDGKVDELVSFAFAFCQHCGKPITFFHFAKQLDHMTFSEAQEYLDSDNYVQTREKRVEDDGGMPLPPLVKLESDVLELAHRRGLSDELIESHGILFSDGDFEYRDRTFYFRNRIFFPIYTREGVLFGFQGRSILDNAGAKYLTAPYMDKSKVLYGAWMTPKNPTHLILCEGVMDYFGWTKIGAYAAGSFGKTISSDQIQILVDIYPDTLYIAFDRDAIEKSFEFVEKHGHRFKRVRVIIMPWRRNSKGKKVGVDSDELGLDQLVKLLSDSVEYSLENKLLSLMMED